MSTAFDILKSACKTKTYKSFSQLTPGTYPVTLFKSIKTRYGVRFVVLIGTTFFYLPQNFSSELKSYISELNKDRFELVYLGRDAHNQNRLLLEFNRTTVAAQQDDVDMDEGVDMVG